MKKNRLFLSTHQNQSLYQRIVPLAMFGGFLAILFFVQLSNPSNDPTIIDTDGDGIVNIDDLDDDNDGIPDSEECKGQSGTQFTIMNGGFESPVNTKNYQFVNENKVDGWYSSSSHNVIEIWKSGFLGIDAYEGNQLAELNAHDFASTYQVIITTPGDILYWSFAHRGRASTTVPDVMKIEIGPEGGISNFEETASDTKTAWGFYSGTYTVPEGQTETRFALTAVSTATGNISVGNLVDDFQLYSLNNCLVDTDGDGIPNSEDLDSDNDGIMDIVEAGGTDTNDDGRVDYAIAGDPTSMLDADLDGLMDSVDDQNSGSGAGEISNGTSFPLYNTDNQGEADYLDLDSDDDGIVDNTEFQASDNYIAPSGADTDGDGLDDAYDIDCTPCGSVNGQVIDPVNSGGNSLPDYRDTDSDGDGLLDALEAHDTNGDGTVDGNDSPFAGTGLSGGSTDTDGDGLLDGFDNDPSGFDCTNGGSLASLYADSNPITNELDWRESVNFPVEWLGFKVKMKDQDAELAWATALELNNEYFEIQRSENGQTFVPVGQVQGVGTSDVPTTYRFLDPQVASLQISRLFYRLKQVDLDGQHSFSSVVELSIEEGIRPYVSAFPNPSQGLITVNWTLEAPSQMGYLRLFSLMGQLLKQQKVSGHESTTDWNLQGIPSGMYILKLQSQHGESSQKLVLER